MSVELTPGIASKLYTASPDDTDFFDQHYVMQVLGVKTVPQATKSEVKRTRVILSDSQHYLQAMYTGQPGNSVEDRGVEKYCLANVRLSCSTVQGKRLLVVSEIDPLEKREAKIGDPANLNKSDDSPAVNADGKPASSAKAPQPAGNVQAPAQQKLPQQKVQRSGSNGNRTIHPIEGLSPYGNSWTIKARCTQKSEMKTWANPRGEGKLFNVTLMDETGEIRGTAFNAVADTLHPIFEEGKVYFVSKARVNLAKKMFSNIQNDYELAFERGTEVVECTDTVNLPQMKYSFVKLDKLNDIEKDATCDVIGLVNEVGPIGEITSKATSRTTKKRELTLVDQTGYSVRLTLWGKHAEQYQQTDGEKPVIAFKGVRVGDFGGRSLSMVSSSVMTVNPDHEDAHALLGWFDNEGKETSFQAHSHVNGSSGLGGGFNRNEMRSITEVKEAELGQADKPEYFSTRATIMHIRGQNIAYPACSGPNCSKKVVEVGNKWRCEKCNLEADEPTYRYIISMAVSDWSGQAWFSGFNEVGTAIFNKDANFMVNKKEENEQEFNVLLSQACGQVYNFACRAKTDSFNESTRVRYGISRIEKLDYQAECNVLLDVLNSAWAKGE